MNLLSFPEGKRARAELRPGHPRKDHRAKVNCPNSGSHIILRVSTYSTLLSYRTCLP